MFERECDILLNYLSKRTSSELVYPDDYIEELPEKLSKETLVNVISVLLANGHIRSGRSTISLENLDDVRIVITTEGRVFANTKTYVCEAKKGKLRQKTENRKNWKERNWHIVAIISYIMGIASALLIALLTKHL